MAKQNNWLLIKKKGQPPFFKKLEYRAISENNEIVTTDKNSIYGMSQMDKNEKIITKTSSEGKEKYIVNRLSEQNIKFLDAIDMLIKNSIYQIKTREFSLQNELSMYLVKKYVSQTQNVHIQGHNLIIS